MKYLSNVTEKTSHELHKPWNITNLFNFCLTPDLPFFIVILVKYCPYHRSLIFMSLSTISFVRWYKWPSPATILLLKSYGIP